MLKSMDPIKLSTRSRSNEVIISDRAMMTDAA